MDANLEPRIVELLFSYLCHELISPVTAVNNGLELVADGDAGTVAEAIGLIRQSAAETSRKLQFYRLAYGQASGFEQARGLVQARELSQGLFQGGRINLIWDDSAIGAAAADRQSVKLLLNLVALARDALPRGGTIAVRLSGVAPQLRAEVASQGTGARLAPEVQAALAADAAAATLTARTVHAYLVAWLGRALGAGLAIDAAGPDRVTFRVTLKPSQ